MPDDIVPPPPPPSKPKKYTVADLDRLTNELHVALKYCLQYNALTKKELDSLIYYPLTLPLLYGYRLTIRIERAYRPWATPDLYVIGDDTDDEPEIPLT